MAARAIGSGTVAFGLVSIPVKLYSSTESGSTLRFNMLNPETGARVKQKYYDPTNNEEIERSALARGYEFAKGQYVIISDEEYKALQAVADNTIALAEFVPAAQIEPVYYDKAYYLGPDKGGERAYRLLCEAMQKTGLVGIATYAARGKQNLVAVRPQGDHGLAMQQLHYADEVRSFDEIPIKEVDSPADAELDLAVQIIEQIARETFDASKYKDEVKERMLELIDQKVEGQEITASAEESPKGQVIDLMDALKKSLGGKPAASKPAKAGSKSTAAKRKPARKAKSAKSPPTRSGKKKSG
jgi:DNA end-binding protein Ku